MTGNYGNRVKCLYFFEFVKFPIHQVTKLKYRNSFFSTPSFTTNLELARFEY